MAPVTVALGLLAASGCVRTEPLRRIAGDLSPSPEDLSLGSLRTSTDAEASGTGAEASGAWLGLDVRPHESDSLDDLIVLPGVRVDRVVPGGPGALAGLRGGDVLLSVGGVDVGDIESFEAVERGLEPGEVVLAVGRRDTAGIEFTLEPVSRGGATSPPRELYRVDPVYLRAEFRTGRVERGEVAGEEASSESRQKTLRTAAVLEALHPESPLLACGLQAGDAILAFDGDDVISAQQLVTRSLAREPGDDVSLVVLRQGELFEADVELWSPPRQLTGLTVPILMTYESARRPSTTTFRLIDLWLFSFFEYARQGGETSWTLLGLFSWQSGYGELSESEEEQLEAAVSMPVERAP